MVKRKKEIRPDSRRRSRDLGDFFMESRAAVFFIGINIVLFLTLRFLARDPFPAELILSPSALAAGKWWTLLTSGFVHASTGHLAINCLGIFIFGRVVERAVGAGKAAGIYIGALFLSMLFAAAAYGLFLHKDVAIVGASGAVMGLVAAATLLSPLAITYELILPLPVMMKGWMFFYADLKGFMGGERDGISHLAHLFGFLSMGILVYFFSPQEQEKMRLGVVINLVSFAVFLALRKWLLLV